MTDHPCPYSEPIIPVMVQAAMRHFPCPPSVGLRVWIDPFAGKNGVRLLKEGVGKIPLPQEGRLRVVAGIHVPIILGVELEPEWANEGLNTACGDAATIRFDEVLAKATPGVTLWQRSVTPGNAVIVTSPAYGGRMADQYLGTPEEQRVRAETGKLPRRRSYAISLGRRLSAGSGAALQWGKSYRDMHLNVMLNWADWGVGGAVINISDHFRDGVLQPVSSWWIEAMTHLAGFELIEARSIATRRFKDGANRDARAERECVLVFKR